MLLSSVLGGFKSRTVAVVKLRLEIDGQRDTPISTVDWPLQFVRIFLTAAVEKEMKNMDRNR